jgi:ABC-type oligopeptide transport system substrate-binding subunit
MQEWQRILGINVNFSVKAAEKDKLTQAVSSGDYQVALYGITCETDNAYEFFGSFTSGSPYNTTGFDGFGMEELIAKLYSADEKSFLSVYSSIESKLYSASLIIPVCNESTYFVCTEDVRDVIYFSGNDKLYFHKATNVK